MALGENGWWLCRPVRITPDPIRGGDSVMVLCEVLNPDGTPHETNYRSTLVEQITSDVLEQECLFGFEQEYTMMDGQSVHGWPEKGYPAPQGPFYCGVVCENILPAYVV